MPQGGGRGAVGEFIGENGAGKCGSGGEGAQFFDLGFLSGDRLPQVGDGLSQAVFGLRDLLGLGTDACVELVLQVGVPLEQSHAVHACFRGQGDDGKAAVGAGGAAGTTSTASRGSTPEPTTTWSNPSA
ncbi:hypothetical protein ACFWVU_00360 [Streptomyces sp. NPDC058686]|uniref:hypothetical protein n=1 Tax=Streptomyces sp. NPDC058686 TaxID=3346599 RepID=UPI0036474AC8